MRIVINGVGIAGPTLAYWLRRAGHEVLLVERSPQLRSGGYAIDFWGVGYDIAEKMGLLPRIRRAGLSGEGTALRGPAWPQERRLLGRRFPPHDQRPLHRACGAPTLPPRSTVRLTERSRRSLATPWRASRMRAIACGSASIMPLRARSIW